MPIHTIHSYLVHPSKSDDDPPPIGGTEVTESTEKLFGMLADTYAAADSDCLYDISFDHHESGKQQNDSRDLIVNYIKAPSIQSGRAIAEHLQSVTTNRSGLGLLFLVLGRESREHKLVISRFPADKGVLAQEDRDGLNIEFLERIFMKSAKAYKAALYQGSALASHFWDGRAVDKQIERGGLTISNYWIKEFLTSDFKTTAAAGTRRLALALREAMKKGTPAVKEEIAAACKLASGLRSRSTSMRAFARRFGLSSEAQKTLRKQVRSDQVFTEQFSFSQSEFVKHVAFRSIELDNGAMLTADASRFDTIFIAKQVDRHKKIIEYKTRGQVIDQKLKRRKS